MIDCLDTADPGPKLSLKSPVLPPFATATRKSGKAGIVIEHVGVTQTLLSPKQNSVHLQIGNRGK